MLDGLALALAAAQQHAVLARGALQGQLVERQALTTGLDREGREGGLALGRSGLTWGQRRGSLAKSRGAITSPESADVRCSCTE